MSEIVCYDTRNMRRINRLYQWDRNFSITVAGLPLSPIPVFQFANRFRTVTIDVIPERNGELLVATIPDALLEQAEPIHLFFYRTDDSDNRKTIASYHFPVRPRVKPGEESLSGINAHYVTFMSDDGLCEYGKIIVIHGENSVDPVSVRMFDVPEKEYTIDWEGQIISRYDYTFDGWGLQPNGDKTDDALNNIESDTVLYAHFNRHESLCAVPYPDMNRNGVIDEEDSNIILKAAALVALGQPSGLTEDQEIMADVDCDGVITAADAHYILLFLREVVMGMYENTPKGWNQFMRFTFEDERFYNVEFYNNANLVLTMANIMSGGGAVYPLEAPKLMNVANPNQYEFVGWDPKPVMVRHDMKCNATFRCIEEAL